MKLVWSDVFRGWDRVDLNLLEYQPNPDMPEWVGWVEPVERGLQPVERGLQIVVCADNQNPVWTIQMASNHGTNSVRLYVALLLRTMRKADRAAADKRAAERMADQTDCCQGDTK